MNSVAAILPSTNKELILFIINTYFFCEDHISILNNHEFSKLFAYLPIGSSHKLYMQCIQKLIIILIASTDTVFTVGSYHC